MGYEEVNSNLNRNEVKIRFNLHGTPVAGETIWAINVGENLFQLVNVPFYAMGYALDDIVRCREKGEFFEVIGLEEDSGNGTVRMYFQPSQENRVKEILDEFKSLGCQVERASETLVAVSIPYNVELPFSQIANYLNSIDNSVIAGWEIGKRIKRKSS